MSSTVSPPGWYTTPDGGMQYWDGAQWTPFRASSVNNRTRPPWQTPERQRPWYSRRRIVIPLALVVLLVPVAVVLVVMAPSGRPTSNPFPAGTPSASSTASASPTMADIDAFGAQPPSEAAIVAVIATGQAQATPKNSPNQRRSALTQRNRTMCALLPVSGPAAVKDWTGRVEETGTTTLTRERWLTVLIADNVRLRTNTGIEDNSDRTMIPAGTELSERVSSLRPGQLVRFSGSFLWDWNDCVENQKLTYNAALAEPDFTFKFAEISPAS